MMTIPPATSIANPWRPVSKPPPVRVVVLIARKSGYITAEWEIMSAVYDPEYRPRNPWLTIGGDGISDSGDKPAFWCYADDLLASLADAQSVIRNSTVMGTPVPIDF